MMQKPEYLEWIEIADQDLNSAIFLKLMIPVPIEIICYHCQQSVEKLLKAFLVKNNIKIGKTHDLTVLYNKSNSIESGFTEIKNECVELTEYSVNIRYPYHIELEITDAENAILSAKKIWDFLIQKLK
jgi:HEPN domain-containing protein